MSSLFKSEVVDRSKLGETGRVVYDFYEAVYADDFDRAFDDYVDENFTFVVGTANNPALNAQIPWAGVEHKGRSGFDELVTVLYGEFEPIVMEPRVFTETGDTVFLEGHFRFKHKVTGKFADSDWLAKYTVKDGRMQGGIFYENTAGVAAARI
jgi:ketosteroid isomerase-like protein